MYITHLCFLYKKTCLFSYEKIYNNTNIFNKNIYKNKLSHYGLLSIKLWYARHAISVNEKKSKKKTEQ